MIVLIMFLLFAVGLSMLVIGLHRQWVLNEMLRFPLSISRRHDLEIQRIHAWVMAVCGLGLLFAGCGPLFIFLAGGLL
ncbi:hypothetical protein YH30_07 [Pseudomonas phage YH30]|uniref:Uncharacterized protein n=2 Tax=Litunavirus TaxID=1920762 RepID=A0A0E3XCZ3_9CAUD|nr:hypothetical protein YH30_07 [Pseudomonas phage YH30]AKC04749.1 hypothetical protein YH30_07 [Pseudomonas phage YH30]WMX17889.1 hypothetical protein PWJ_gp12 [Pseudomonas phage PWJ]